MSWIIFFDIVANRVLRVGVRARDLSANICRVVASLRATKKWWDTLRGLGHSANREFEIRR